MADHIPHEILEKIFFLACPEIDVFHGKHAEALGDRSSTWTLSYVSRKWRAVALESKALWRRLLFVPRHHPQRCDMEPRVVFRICLALSRSGDLPFSIRIDLKGSESCWFYCSTTAWVFGPLFAHSRRLEAYIDDRLSDGLDVLSACTLPLPRLHTLRVSGYHVPSSELRRPLLDLDAPSLRTVWLHGMEVDDLTDEPLILSLSPRPYPQVRTLVSEGSDLGYPDGHEPSIGHTFFKRSMSLFPNLETLQVFAEDPDSDYVWSPGHQQPTRMHMNNMKTVSIEGAGANILFILNQLRTPHLAELHLDLKDSPNLDWDSSEDEDEESAVRLWESYFVKSVARFLNKLEHKSSLTALSFYGTSDLPILKIVADLPNLQALAVDQQLYDNELAEYMTWTLEKATRTLPHLESLTWKFVPDATDEENQRIVTMIDSRVDPPGTPARSNKLDYVRILYEPAHLDDLVAEGTGLLDWLSADSGGYCLLVPQSLDELDWRPLRPCIQRKSRLLYIRLCWHSH
jgi:hypothetical protein